ncbi:alpha/beta fold hydrolase [Paenibacillus bovis]|uniref:Hydrolase n=1 Tax=Paenibacillus bovis TaxID=1616788 RepID=A0A172ZB27_9BACL|nr:alpha/beta fold hydrolase [Paenibacillus bovis]ANF94844.1 hydrolase [Paenibacillus bovis]
MIDYTTLLPDHTTKYIGEYDLYLEMYNAENPAAPTSERPPLLFVHGAYTGSWMWSKYIPHFVRSGWTCYCMNLRGHYRSRAVDMSKVTVEDYLDDIRTIINECGQPPILIGFSMGGILSQKIAESAALAGLVIIDSSLSREVHEQAPYPDLVPVVPGLIIPPPIREETTSLDESADDIAFQRKYLSMEAALAFGTISVAFGAQQGISIDGSLIKAPALVIKAVNNDIEDRQGRLTAKQLHAEYTGLQGTTHTGLLVGQRYHEGADRILTWLEQLGN